MTAKPLSGMSAALLLGVLSLPLAAQPWVFAAPVDITPEPKQGVFHHLDASGRRHLAVSDNIVAVTWEDNRDGRPAAHVATFALGDSRLSEFPVSGTGEAYEPSILAMGGGSFLLAWEENEAVWVRSLGRDGPTWPVKLADHATQISLTSDPNNKYYAVWAEQQERFSRIHGAELRIAGGAVTPQDLMEIDADPGDGNQSSPVAAFHPRLEALIVVWEDRRYGNVVLLSAIGSLAKRFSIPMQINELFPPRSGRYGRGTGVARPVVATYGSSVAVAWPDKRKYEYGYDIYAAIAAHSGRFGDNMLVQDSFGEGYEQWHPAIAAASGTQLAVAWDDNRDGSSDIWLSWDTPNGWSEDFAVPGAAGTGEETHPSLTFDAQGNLHLVWIERDRPGAPTRLRYAFGRKN